uniref:hypothetical protein n=1 Tax=Altererythrobacter segetis TaxID=1104773 RepID=UPI0014097F4C|nr:hypothetical protein [Altererythrobacter segetis]
MTTPNWVSVIALLGWLVLSFSAFRVRQLNAGRTVVYALIWGAIFLAAAAIFGAVT